MARWHLFEWEDQPWFPATLRDYGTDFLRFLAEKSKMYHPIVPQILEVMESSGQDQIVDLAAGAGGGLESIYSELKSRKEKLKVVLTDLYPNEKAFLRIVGQYPDVAVENDAVDARFVPKELMGLRTMFLSFHHFKPEDAQAILQDAVHQRMPIAIFEAQERSVPSILAMIFSPITVLVTTPFIKPLRLGRFVFTYLLPIVPLFVLWDGVVSALRTYSKREMQALIQQVDGHESFDWKVEKVKSGPGVILHLIGTPIQA